MFDARGIPMPKVGHAALASCAIQTVEAKLRLEALAAGFAGNLQGVIRRR
jgi:hypothetical protein